MSENLAPKDLSDTLGTVSTISSRGGRVYFCDLFALLYFLVKRVYSKENKSSQEESKHLSETFHPPFQTNADTIETIAHSYRLPLELVGSDRCYSKRKNILPVGVISFKVDPCLKR